MAEQIRVPIGGNKFLVAERNPDPAYDREIYIFVEQNGVVTQDIALVRQAFRYKPDGQLDWKDDVVETCIWADANNEDFTNEYIIDVYNESEEDKASV